MNISPISTKFIVRPHFLGEQRKLLPAKCDSFQKSKDTGSQGKLIDKYGLNMNDIEVKSTTKIYLTNEQKELFINKILEAHELAKKNVETGNITGVGYATNLCLSDNSWHLATNFSNTRNDISCVCGERSAVLVAYNNFLEKLIKNNDSESTQKDFKVKYLVMSSDKEIGTDKNASSPCADCLSWFNTTKFFDDDTKVVYLTKDETTGQYALEFKTLKEMLPMRGRDAIDAIPSNNNLSFSSFVVSNDAERIMQEKGITTDDIKNTLKKARQTYNNPTDYTPYSEQKIGACIKTGDKYFCAPKIDWSKRWFMEPAEFAIAKSLEENNSAQMPDIIAYYGNNETICKGEAEQDGVVSIKTLGRIKSLDKNAEPLIVVVNGNDEVDVSSINDFMPKGSTFTQDYVK